MSRQWRMRWWAVIALLILGVCYRAFGQTQAAGTVHVFASRPLGTINNGGSWSNFQMVDVLPPDAVITGIYPVARVNASNPDGLTQWLSYGTGASVGTTVSSFTVPITPTTPVSPGQTFSTSEFYGGSIGTSLGAISGQGITVYYADSLFSDGLNDTMNVVGAGFAVYYTSATPAVDTQMPPPIAVPGGTGVAWAMPLSTANTGNSGVANASSSPWSGSTTGPVIVKGNVINPDGTPFTGTAQISLAKSTIVNVCTTPATVIPFPGVTVKIVNGVFTPTSLISTECLSPRLPFYVQIKDKNGRVLVTDNWYVPHVSGPFADVGTLGETQMAAGINVAVPLAIVSTPAGNQTVTQPPGTSLSVNNLTVTGNFAFSGTLSLSDVAVNTITASTSVTTSLITATTGNITTVNATTVNATNYEVGGVALAASNLSNGVNGTGPVCLQNSSTCGSAASNYQTVKLNNSAQTARPALNFSSAFAASDSASPAQTNIDLAAQSVAGAYTNANVTVDSHGIITAAANGVAAGGTTYVWGFTSCANNVGQPTQCLGSTTLPGNMPNATYSLHCDVYSGTEPSDQFINVSTWPLPTSAGGTLNYRMVQVMQNGTSGGVTLPVVCFAHHA